VIGNGPLDIVFVPGMISHVEFFHELPGYTEFLDGLAQFARVIVFDKRGNGLSDRIAGTPTLEDRMDDIRAVMVAVSSERAALFAVSEGGPISLMFSATYPTRVEAIVLYETFVRYGGVADYPAGMVPDAHKTVTEAMVENWGTGLSLTAFGTSYALDPHVRSLWGRAERLSDSPGGFRMLYELLRDIDARPVLGSVRAPCLVIHGGQGSMFMQHGEYLAKHLPNARLDVLDGIDHFPWFAGGDRTVAEVEEFLTGTRSAVVADRVLATLLFTDIVDSTERAAAW
jgi:pimeloyl-ACP methyl ester carboxylesterase